MFFNRLGVNEDTLLHFRGNLLLLLLSITQNDLKRYENPNELFDFLADNEHISELKRRIVGYREKDRGRIGYGISQSGKQLFGCGHQSATADK